MGYFFYGQEIGRKRVVCRSKRSGVIFDVQVDSLGPPQTGGHTQASGQQINLEASGSDP